MKKSTKKVAKQAKRAKGARKARPAKVKAHAAVQTVVAKSAPAAEVTLADEAKPKGKRAATKANRAAGDAKPKRLSALDAAAEVLKKAGKPMRSQEMIAAMAEQGLWTSPAGKTPHATLYAAILREATTRGDAARFKKVDRGQFVFNG